MPGGAASQTGEFAKHLPILYYIYNAMYVFMIQITELMQHVNTTFTEQCFVVLLSISR